MEETLLSAARRVVRYFNIDMNGHGGLVSEHTQIAVDTLDQMVRETTAAALKRGDDPEEAPSGPNRV